MGTLSGKLPVAVTLAVVASLAGNWFRRVDSIVPKPYLDEFFHVPQAQKYCESDWHSWNPKITTPPGLYLVSWAFSLITGSCSTSALRALNVGALGLIFLQIYEILGHLDRHQVQRQSNGTIRSNWDRAHSALNISLFPPLFFFSGLFYTDVMSTLFVLLSYSAFLKRKAGRLTAPDAIKAVSIGLVALLFRQTNIFWVAVLPGGLAVVEAMKIGYSETKLDNTAAVHPTKVFQASWNEGAIYDCSVTDASPLDYIMFLVSVAIVAIRKPFMVTKIILPYIILVSLFGAFVAWNGGVVLGDKSNHIATLHIPQMLYIWPYICFFSFPLVFTQLMRQIVDRLPESKVRSACILRLPQPLNSGYSTAISATLFMIFGLAAVYLNTIVHPFTLADNRHYVFYVFRILLRHPAIKYLAVPVYVICGWLAIEILGLRGLDQVPTVQDDRTVVPVRADSHAQQISFVVAWLATTALSVVTAPLVEPRYFIIPWMIWRLNVPSSTAPSSTPSVSKSAFRLTRSLETVWLIAINAMVGYNFLYRGFIWETEPGNIQRFLW